MISIKKVSNLPVTGFIGTYQKSKVVCATGYAHAAAIRPESFRTESNDGQIVQLSSPKILKEVMGIDKYFVEKRGSEMIACAATKKLLAEEQLRRQGFSTPINSIVREHWRSKPSTLRPICPLTQEDL